MDWRKRNGWSFTDSLLMLIICSFCFNLATTLLYKAEGRLFYCVYVWQMQIYMLLHLPRHMLRV